MSVVIEEDKKIVEVEETDNQISITQPKKDVIVNETPTEVEIIEQKTEVEVQETNQIVNVIESKTSVEVGQCGWIVPDHKKEFDTSDWVLSGEYYELEVQHQLGKNPNVEIYDSSNSVRTLVQLIDENTIKLKVPAEPDLRFQGTIKLI